MAIQFSLSYNANGDPVLVENTVTGTRTVINQPLVVSEYKPRFTSNQVDQVDADTETDTDNQRSDIYKYINEMENNADDDQNLSFVQKQNLEAYTPEAIEAKGKELTNTQKFAKTVLSFLTPLGQVETFAKALNKILPQESEEIKAIKQFYADPEQQQLVESIPGMSNYNLVYGNPFDPSYGLAGAAAKRISTIDKTLQRQIDKGLDPSQTLIERKKKLQELIDKEKGEISRIEKQKNEDLQNIVTLQDPDPAPSGGGGQDSGNQGSSSPTGTNRPGGPNRPDDAGSPGSKGPGGSDEMGSF